MTRWIRSLAAVALALTGVAAQAQNWQLVWQDEFTNGIGPQWRFETGTGSGGWGNNELQYYRRENATVENGQLVITAKREDFGGMRYTSSRMTTQGLAQFKYGRIEARIKAPSSSGMWPAFWMLGSNINSVGWPASGEIDIMEHVNADSDIHGTIHWQGPDGGHASYGGHTPTNVADYHIYAVEWDEKTIRWFVDGRQFHVVDITNSVNSTEEFHRDFFLLLNLAVGGNWPQWNIDESRLPAKMYVDYVRVYKKDAGTAFSTTLQAANFALQSGMQLEASTEGGQNLGWIETGDWAVWNLNLPQGGTYTVEYRVASLNGGGALQLEMAGGAPVYGALGVPSTGGWQNWTTISHRVTLPAGQQQIAVKANGPGWNLRSVKITKS
ncbi:family 16 glycosylhydrolase [Mitsuaria sp. CC2]|jgi:beta-glucanase (GH16 family)|uniref:carbohydrate-binding protein n=1 Tax=Mitsuaria sp. CC2 TaxID=3029186 RepID=UPI003B8DB5EF